ncbi:MAG: hypothetical protein J6L69_10405 [Lachnospiraceae bacterium]|nr:hypothetical protein [Lachnospiraceae bacterium]
MNKQDIEIKTSAELIDILVAKQKEEKELKSEIDILKGEIQTRGVKVLEERNTKFIEFFGAENGIASVQIAQKMEILNFFKLQETLGEEFLNEKIKRVPADVKYEIDKKFGQAVAALVTGDYAKGYTLSEVVEGITDDTKQRNLLLKKLKGDYKADKKTICSVIGVTDAELDMDTELFLIGKIINWQLIEAFFDTENEDKFNKLKNEIKKCIIVDETVKIAAKSVKEENVA